MGLLTHVDQRGTIRGEAGERQVHRCSPDSCDMVRTFLGQREKMELTPPPFLLL